MNIGTTFENGVVLYGSQSNIALFSASLLFENGVVLYGSQSPNSSLPSVNAFENGVVYRFYPLKHNNINGKINNTIVSESEILR